MRARDKGGGHKCQALSLAVGSRSSSALGLGAVLHRKLLQGVRNVRSPPCASHLPTPQGPLLLYPEHRG